MTNHPNRGWRSRWSINLEAATVTHCDGWIFQFSPVVGEHSAFNGKCLAQPEPMTPEQMHQVPRIAREAGDIYIEARNARH